MQQLEDAVVVGLAPPASTGESDIAVIPLQQCRPAAMRVFGVEGAVGELVEPATRELLLEGDMDSPLIERREDR